MWAICWTCQTWNTGNQDQMPASAQHPVVLGNSLNFHLPKKEKMHNVIWFFCKVLQCP